jgi:hypothetical protein
VGAVVAVDATRCDHLRTKLFDQTTNASTDEAAKRDRQDRPAGSDGEAA